MKRPVMFTFMRREVNPLDLKIEDIDVRDIAHHLAYVNRFGGAPDFSISVAQHSCYVHKLCDDMSEIAQIQALLHDASEAYLGDVTKWLKATSVMAGYREAEDRAMDVICKRFGIPTQLPLQVEWADRVMVRFEGFRGFGPSFRIDHPNYPPLTPTELSEIGDWEPWTPQRAEQEFLFTARKLGL